MSRPGDGIGAKQRLVMVSRFSIYVSNLRLKPYGMQKHLHTAIEAPTWLLEQILQHIS